MCDRWLIFDNFRADMERTWSAELEIDRISSDGNYCPENCRWATRHQQTRNVSNNVWYELNGMRKIAADWAKDLGGNVKLIRQRIKLGWPLEKALTTPAAKRIRHV